MKTLARPDGPGCRPSDDAASRHPGKAASIPRAAPLKVLDLFSGIGGFSLGLERTGGFRTVAFCEIEPFPRRVLAKHWPEVPCYDDVRTLTAERLRADGIAVDVICGGFPCQDISVAGKGLGLAGARSGLWSQIARLASELRPRYVLVENVSALLDRGLGAVLGDLASLGFDAEWHCIPASALGAYHRRDRIWIVAYADGNRRPDFSAAAASIARSEAVGQWRKRFDELGAGDGLQRDNSYAGIRRAVHGLPDWSHRLHGLGNAVVPQIPELIGNAILASLAQETEARRAETLGSACEGSVAEGHAPKSPLPIPSPQSQKQESAA